MALDWQTNNNTGGQTKEQGTWAICKKTYPHPAGIITHGPSGFIFNLILNDGRANYSLDKFASGGFLRQTLEGATLPGVSSESEPPTHWLNKSYSYGEASTSARGTSNCGICSRE
jgi:hypothetical protein